MKCLGPSLYLKNNYGKGYSLHINYHPHAEAVALSFIEELLPEARLIENYAGSCTYQVPNRNLKISELLEVLESKKDEFAIIDWGINQTSLEDVFLNVAKIADTDQTE